MKKTRLVHSILEGLFWAWMFLQFTGYFSSVKEILSFKENNLGIQILLVIALICLFLGACYCGHLVIIEVKKIYYRVFNKKVIVNKE